MSISWSDLEVYINLPEPAIQSKSLRFLRIRRITDDFQSKGRHKLLSLSMTRLQRPTLAAHLKLGPREWGKTAEVLRDGTPYWAHVFYVGRELQELAIEQLKLWHMVPIFGTSGTENIVNLDSL